MKLLSFLLLLCTFKSFGQYPFEKYPAVKYQKLIVKGDFYADSSFIGSASYKKYKLIFKQQRAYKNIDVAIFYNGKVTSNLHLALSEVVLAVCDTIYMADIDGNGKPDFKFILQYNGSGLAGSLSHKVLLFNSNSNRFKAKCYIDFFDGPERDFNNDGKYEIIGQVYESYQGHAYMVYNLFNYIKGSFHNVNKLANYPIMIQYLERENYKITDKISRKGMKQFSVRDIDYFKFRN